MKKFILMVAIALGASHFSNTVNEGKDTHSVKIARATTHFELEPGGDDGGIPVPPPKFP
jgi:hypothetical protein